MITIDEITEIMSKHIDFGHPKGGGLLSVSKFEVVAKEILKTSKQEPVELGELLGKFNELAIDAHYPDTWRGQNAEAFIKQAYAAGLKSKQVLVDIGQKYLDRQGEKIKTLRERLNKANELFEWFCLRIEKGEVRSKRTYEKFKEFLNSHKE